MTEQEWLKCTGPHRMLEFLRDKVTDRKLRLFACACCRRIWHLLTDVRSQRTVELVERFADKLTTRKELVASQADAMRAVQAVRVAGRNAKEAARTVWRAAAVSARKAASGAARGVVVAASWKAIMAQLPFPDTLDFDARLEARRAWGHAVHAATEGERAAQTSILRDLIGPFPFRPVAINPVWLTWNDSTVQKIAQGIWSSPRMVSAGLSSSSTPCRRISLLINDLQLHVAGVAPCAPAGSWTPAGT